MDDILFQSLIDVDLWNSARWKGTAFFNDLDGVNGPSLGIMFDDIDVGKQIFSGLLQRLGSIDLYEELRISVVEGEIPGEKPGYSVLISSDPTHSMERARPNASQVTIGAAVILSRFLRMTPALGSPHLSQFKNEFARHKHYFLIPISSDCKPQCEFAIRKTKIFFRQALEISASDVDAVVFRKNYFQSERPM